MNVIDCTKENILYVLIKDNITHLCPSKIII